MRKFRLDPFSPNGVSLENDNVTISSSATSTTSGVQSVVAGTNVTVDNTDPANPIVSATGEGGTTDHALLTHLDYASAGHTGFAPALGADDNYVTDAEKIIIGNTSGTNTGDNAVNTLYEADVTMEEVQDNLGGTTGGDGFLKSTDSHLIYTYDDAGNALTLTVVPIVCHTPTGIEFGSATQQYDVTGTTYVSAVAGGSLGGIPASSSGNTLADCIESITSSRDGKYLNVQEKSGAASTTNPLTVQFLFSGITRFNTINTRSWYQGNAAHNLQIQLWNFVTSAWDTYATFSDEPNYVARTIEVFSPTLYISAGVVKLQFIHISNGIATHDILFDYIALCDGGGGSGGASIASAVSYTPTGNISATNVQNAINELDNEKVASNVAITGATKTKITYDSKGLVTSGADATTADIADSTNKRYVTDAQLTIIGNTSGTNTGDQTNITGSAGSLKSPSTTGVGQLSGMGTGTTRVYSVPDSDATLLYSGGALGTPSSGTLTNCTFPTLNQDTTGTAAIATSITVSNEVIDTTCFPLFATSDTGNLGAKSNANLTYNSSSATLSTPNLSTNYINEKTSGNGVVIDSFLIKDANPKNWGNWINPDETWEFSSVDGATGVITIPSDGTTKYSLGMKVQFTQTTVKYGIIVGITSTTMTIYTGTDYTLANATISNNFYSSASSPFGFPKNPDKWTVTASSTSDFSQASSSTTIYNAGSFSIAIPIGLWDVKYKVLAQIGDAGASAGAKYMTVSLSTANNTIIAGNAMSIAGADIKFTRSYVEKTLSLLLLSSKTTYYLNFRDDGGSSSNLYILGASSTTVIQAVCAYL